MARMASAAPAFPQPLARFYRPELDTLRFIAFFGVFVRHSVPAEPSRYAALGHVVGGLIADMVRAGSFGVDLFFALSAYLITELLLREKNATGTLKVADFIRRRVLRIWPLYFFIIAVATFLPRMFPSEALGTGLGWNYLTMFVLLSGNWACALIGLPDSVVAPLWSVSIEEQFYLGWPFIAKRATRRGIIGFAIALLFLAITVRVIAGLKGATGIWLWCATLSRLDPIAAGILMSALLKHRIPSFRLWQRSLLVLLSVTALTLAAMTGITEAQSSFWKIQLGYPLAAVGAAALLLAILGSNLQNGWMSYLGKISYGLYVYHLLVLRVVQHNRFGLGKGAIWVMGFALTLGVSAVSYELLEKPFLRLKRKYTHIESRPA